MSLLPSASTAFDASLHKCSNYCYTGTCASVLTDALSFPSNDILVEQQVISGHFQNELVSPLPLLYNSKMSKTSLDFPAQPFSDITSNRNSGNDITSNRNSGEDTLLSSDGSQENLELQKYIWKCVQNQGESGNYIHDSKSYDAPDSNDFLRETHDAAGDKNHSLRQVYEVTDEGDPQEPSGEIKPREYLLDGYTTSAEETSKKVENDNIERFVWLGVQQPGELENPINEAKSYVPGSNHLFRETQSVVCDKNPPSREVYDKADEGHPQETNEGTKSTKYFLDDYTTSEGTVLKVQDDGVEIAWMDVKVVYTTGGYHFNCSICYTSFKSQSDVTLHLQEHGITKPFKCLWCEISSETVSEAKVHHSSHSGIMLFDCNFCNRQFSKETLLQRHKVECGVHLDSLSANLQFHSSNSSIEDTTTSEDDGDESDESVTRTMTSKGLEENHPSYEVKGGGNQSSSDCSLPSMHIPSDNSVNDVQTLKENNPSKETSIGKKSSKKARKNFQCLTCGKKFRASKPLREHEVVHTGAREFPCEICGKAFGTKANMRIHLATHSDRKPFACNICNSRFRQKDSLKVHSRKHNGERPFACTVCSMTFDRSFTLKNHLLTHGDERSHVCAVCGKAFTTRGGLNNHERLHLKDPTKKKARKPPSKPGTGNWICDECGKLYSTRSNLRMHQRSHEPTSVTHPCYVCGRVYKHKDSLEVHMRKHTDNRPFSCHTCGRNFYRNWTLKLHELTHTGEKPHKCPVDGCNKAFTQSSSRYNHVQTHHKDPDRLKKKSVHDTDATQCIPEGVNLPNNPVSSANQSESIVINAIQGVDTLPNNHALEVAPLYLVDTQDRNPTLPDQVENLILPPPTSLNLDTSVLTGDPLAVKVGTEEINPSVLNGLSLNAQSVSMTPEIIPQQPGEIAQNNHLNLATHHIDEPLCPIDVSSTLVWGSDVLSMGLSNIHLPQTHQANPPTLQTLPQSLDPSLYVLPENVPLLVGVDGHIYQQDTHLKMAGLQNNYVSQLH